MEKKHPIPVRSLKERGKANFEINRIQDGIVDVKSHPSAVEHRDDYYTFIYQQNGSSNITVDFQDITIRKRSIFCIQPGQVHFGSFGSDTTSWIISVASDWVAGEYRHLLMGSVGFNRPVTINSATDEKLLHDSLCLLQEMEEQVISSNEQIIKTMFDVYLQLFIKEYHQASGNQLKLNSRAESLTRQFRHLLISNYRIMKSPAEYATVLNITPAYLNEVVKDITGNPVSYWIHQEIILEAKRTLFYTDSAVKEVAHLLGFSDPAYFNRLFKKITGISPLQFRQKYRK